MDHTRESRLLPSVSDAAIERDHLLVEVRLTAIEGNPSGYSCRQLIERNLALLEPLVEDLRRRLAAGGVSAGHSLSPRD